MTEYRLTDKGKQVLKETLENLLLEDIIVVDEADAHILRICIPIDPHRFNTEIVSSLVSKEIDTTTLIN